MTEQVPDSCTYLGKRWVIANWRGETGCIPTNEQLGIRTHSPSTANWRGRIDHFTVFHNQLYLLKMEVTLPDDDREQLPYGAGGFDQLEASRTATAAAATRRRLLGALAPAEHRQREATE